MGLKVGIIGLGYVGLPLSLAFSGRVEKVIGFDIDQAKIDSLKMGVSYLNHISDESINKEVMSNYFEPTSDFAKIEEVDAIIICVPTPLDNKKTPDLTYIINTLNKIKPYLRENQLLSLESTTYPGTTEEIIKPVIEDRGFKIGQNFHLVYSPEREDPGNNEFNTRTIPKVIGGYTNNCLARGVEIYEHAIDNLVPVETLKEAELTKLLENIYRSVNIGLVNEMKMVADKMGINIWNVISAASTKPFGFVPFFPGPGLGGHCLPVDPFYLTWKAKEYGVNTKFIELAGEINSQMPNWILSKIIDLLNEQRKSIKGSKVLLVGLSYKKNIDDTRESPAVDLYDLLNNKGAEVYYYDPLIPQFPEMRKYKYSQSSVELTPEILAEFDCVVITTDHDIVDYKLIKKYANLIIDTRGVYKTEYNKKIYSS